MQSLSAAGLDEDAINTVLKAIEDSQKELKDLLDNKLE